jgi:2-polyprenyl-3-methyl-5-hydroxy-6-metoxy-1,4-benzoquinol methylase
MNLHEVKYTLWVSKEWLKRMFTYPQKIIVPGAHFDYDSYWKEKRGAYMGRLGRWQARRVALAASVIKAAQGKSINDIGGGAGEVIKAIKDASGVSIATVYDISPYALEIAKSFGLKTNLFDINDEKTFASIEPVDFTILFEILEHVPGSELLLKSAYEKSRMGVLFSFPNTGFFIHRFRLFFFGKFPLQWTKHPGEHLRFWTKKDLLWWLKAQGYSNYRVHYYVGIPVLRYIWPNMFAAGFFVEVRK